MPEKLPLFLDLRFRASNWKKYPPFRENGQDNGWSFWLEVAGVGPQTSVTTKTSAYGLFFVYRGPSGHVVDI